MLSQLVYPHANGEVWLSHCITTTYEQVNPGTDCAYTVSYQIDGRITMDTPTKSKKTTRIFGILIIAVFAAELILCFTGPFAFISKPSLMLFPPLTTSLDDRENREVAELIERELALSNSYSIVSNKFIEEYYIRTDPDESRTKIAIVNEDEAFEIARELGLDRYAVATVSKSANSFWLFVFLNSTRDGKTIRSATIQSSSVEEGIKAGSSESSGDGDAVSPDESIRSQLKIETRGIGFTDILVLALLGIQFLVGAIALTGRNPGVLVDVFLSLGVILFLFAFIHAQSANMDYVQRYIANGGALKLAQSTAEARLYAFLRFGPILAIGLAFYAMKGVGRTMTTQVQLKRSWLDRYVKPWALLWTVLSAVLYAISFPSFVRLDGLSPVAWISLVPLFLVMLSSKPAPAVLYGVVFGTIQALIINYWHGTYNYVTLHMITIAFVVEFTLFMIPFVLALRLSGKWGFLVAPAAWTLFEFLRSSGVLGYPWGLTGTTQYGFLPLIQIASITGVWGIGFIVVLVNAGIAWTASGFAIGWHWPVVTKLFRNRRRLSQIFPLAVSTSVFLIAVICGSVILSNVQKRLDGADESATVVLLQQNTDPRKHEIRNNTEKLMDLTDLAVAELAGRGERADLIAWPEGGFRLDLRYWMIKGNRNASWGGMVKDFMEYQKGLGTWLATGTQDHTESVFRDGSKEKQLFNSSVFLDPEGEISKFYHKMQLVPFSEHFPLDKDKYAGLYEMFQGYDISNWTMGAERRVFQAGDMRIATPICFEDVFPDHVRRFVKKDVDIILNMSNDYWSLSPVEGKQHGIFSLFRAVENQRPVLRTTCSGYTVAISATGEIQPGAPKPYTEGYAIARVPLPEQYYTFYTRFGDWFPRACGIFILSFLVIYNAVRLVKRLRRRLRHMRVCVPIGDMSGDELPETRQPNASSGPAAGG
jgi:apolipoprotein N-acyltransferase